MKITAVKVRLFEYPMPKPFHPTWQPVPTTAARIHVVEVHTDEGIVGIGSGGVPVRWEVAGLFLMGQDPFAMEQHVANLRSMAFFVGRPWPVEIALWDIIGKATGQPIYKLLGGGSEKLKVYASIGDGIDIMVDGNWGWRIAPDRQLNRWDLKTAIDVVKACEEHGVYWLEPL